MINTDSFEEFKKEYSIELNSQQEQAVKNTDGKSLLLAVPGSGKTTVLVDRLGYMIIGKKINPENILVVTFNRLAAQEIKNRYICKFGKENAERLSIQTINSLSLQIYTRFCRETGHPFRENIEGEKKILLLNIYRRYMEEQFPGESDISDLETSFSYIKNMCIKPDEIRDHFSLENMAEMFKTYEKTLKDSGKMDFDDQMAFAKWILENRKSHYDYWRQKYRYICVDEAQDTSFIQHRIIELLSKGNNLFMVGDEDQSIYGFRGAYPDALLQFKKDYPDGKIIKMETNYRSTNQIVNVSNRFINLNNGRYNKKMVAASGDGDNVRVIEVNSREGQFRKLIEISEEAQEETALLYRDNESAIALVDLLLRNNISFRYNGKKMNFFNNKVISDYIAYLRLIYNNNDYDAFEKIGNKSSLRMNRQEVNFITESCRRRNLNLFSQLRLKDEKSKGNIDTFITLMENLKDVRPDAALRKIRSVIYSNYTEKYKIDDSSVEILIILASEEEKIEDFLLRIEYLNEYCNNPPAGDYNSRIILSTIHGSKGMEFDSVYLFDVFDDKFPAIRGDSSKEEKEKQMQEERRLFYVGLTRAKKHLNIIKIRGKRSGFIASITGKKENIRKTDIKSSDINKKPVFTGSSYGKMSNVPTSDILKEFSTGQQKTVIRDTYGRRWLKCRVCRKIKPEERFAVYDEDNDINFGICNKCRRIKKA